MLPAAHLLKVRLLLIIEDRRRNLLVGPWLRLAQLPGLIWLHRLCCLGLLRSLYFLPLGL